MPPKANEAIDSLIKQAENPSIAEFLFNYMDIPGVYEKTYVPGEAELAARVFGIEDKVNPYTYMHTQSVTPAIPFLDSDLYRINTKNFEEGTSYFPEQSPLLESEPNIFNVNPETEFGQNLQDRINAAYSLALLNNIYDENPETGEQMLKGEEPLLGDIYFGEGGEFEDVWDIGMGEYEPVLNSKDSPLSALVNLMRVWKQDEYQMNVPTVKGRANKLEGNARMLNGAY